jgi:hypothetical protein
MIMPWLITTFSRRSEIRLPNRRLCAGGVASGGMFPRPDGDARKTKLNLNGFRQLLRGVEQFRRKADTERDVWLDGKPKFGSEACKQSL